jgi:hypothetical protein
MEDDQTSEVHADLTPVNADREILNSDKSSEEKQLLIKQLLRKTKQKYEHGGLLTFKINIFFHGDNS